jgi:two-component sensor histidine kinase
MAMAEFLREISILQLVPAVCAGILFTGMGMFLYLYISSRQKVHLTMLILSLLAALFTTCEFLFIVYGALVKSAATAVQFHRLEQVLGAYFISALPFFLYHHLSPGPTIDKMTRAITYVGFIFALFITIIAYVQPDLFISVENTRLTNWHIDVSTLRRGQEGVFYHARDIVLGVVLFYSIFVLIFDIIKNKNFRYTFVIFIGSLAGTYFAAEDIIHVYTGRHIDFLKNADYQRFPVGVSIFVLLSMVSVFRKFLDSDKALKRANIQLIQGREEMRNLNSSLELALREQEKSLKEKEILLKEIHHRVKNNLQIINSLLYLQSTQNEDELIERILLNSQNRINAMALIHEHLYQKDDLSTIDMQEYLEELVSQLLVTHCDEGNTRTVNQYVSAKDIYIPLDTAMPVGLIANELVTNSLIHGLENNTEGAITVELSHHDYMYTLAVEDNGCGIPPGIDPESAESMGLSLVRLLSKQLHGSVSFETETGTKGIVVFPFPVSASFEK